MSAGRPLLEDRGEYKTSQSFTIKIKNQISVENLAQKEKVSKSTIINLLIEKYLKNVKSTDIRKGNTKSNTTSVRKGTNKTIQKQRRRG